MNSERLSWALRVFLRLFVTELILLSISVYINKSHYSGYYHKTIFRVQTVDFNILSHAMPAKVSALLSANDNRELQDTLNSTFGLFGLVVTDCKTIDQACDGQTILASTNPKFGWKQHLSPEALKSQPYDVLRTPPPVFSEWDFKSPHSVTRIPSGKVNQGEVIGRLYYLRNVPFTFTQDYAAWLKSPFKDTGPRRNYLIITLSMMLIGLVISLIVEFSLYVKRSRERHFEVRENSLLAQANILISNSLEKDQKLADQEKYLEELIEEFESLEKLKESDILKIKVQLSSVSKERDEEKLTRELVESKLAEYESASVADRKDYLPKIESAISNQFANKFEKAVFDVIDSSNKVTKGDWRILVDFDANPGGGSSKCIDCLLITRHGLFVIEAKNYNGRINTNGDVENNEWLCSTPNGAEIAIKATPLNPYKQVKSYSDGIMSIVKNRSAYNMPVYGIVVFPAESDTSQIGAQIGRYYRITTLDKILSVIGQIESEITRGNIFTKRPSVIAVENMLIGRSSGLGLRKAA